MKSKLYRNLALVLAIIIAMSTFSMTSCEILDDIIASLESEGGNDTLEPMLDPTDDNYRTFYHIFVGSFSDGTNDGVGDLRGIINRMDYLNDGDINNGNDLGVQGIWLSPIFSSPSYHKYDTKDYYTIDWRFGMESDLVELVNLCHERNVKLIIDLAINHTSNQHPWFLEFKEAHQNGDTSNKYYNYYTWTTLAGQKNNKTYQKIAGIDCYYEANFTGDMPELNFDNPEVREEMLNVAKYYLDLGVDGFRFDAVKYIYFNEGATKNANFWEWYMGELRAVKPDIYCVGECWSGDNEVIQYYGAMNCFNFTVAQAEGIVANAAKGQSISTYLSYMESYQDKVQAANPNGMMSAFLSNHDTNRIAGTFILEGNMRIAANLYLLAHGSPFIYYGEELGMKGSRGSEATDANRRLAMLWGDGDRVSNPTGSTYPSDKQIQTTVADQLEDPNSLLSHYAKLINIRTRYPAIARGDYNAVTSSNRNFGGFYVDYQGETIGIFHNTSVNELTVDLSKCSGLDGHTFTQLLEAVGGNATLNGTVLTIAAQTSVIVK